MLLLTLILVLLLAVIVVPSILLVVFYYWGPKGKPGEAKSKKQKTKEEGGVNSSFRGRRKCVMSATAGKVSRQLAARTGIKLCCRRRRLSFV